jgi:HSP20 family protein
MALVRWSPTSDILSIRDHMNRLFNEVLRGWGVGEGVWSTGTLVPPVDIYETDDALVVKAELPGFAKDELSVECQDNTLILKGTRERSAEVPGAQYHRVERTYGSFQRAFVLPAMVDAEKAQATYKDGVLELRLPKLEAAKPKRIAISA